MSRAETFSLSWTGLTEKAPSHPLRSGEEIQSRNPSYGRYLEEFNPGEVYVHPRGVTLHAALAQDFATTFMESCPIFLNEESARMVGFEKQPVSPLMILATTLSLGVQNESEKAIAHLGYYNVCFPRVTYVGETLRAMTRVLDRKAREPGEPGIVHVQTIGFNERNEVAIRYERKIMIKSNPASKSGSGTSSPSEFLWPEKPEITLPVAATRVPKNWVSGKTFFEDFKEGEVIVHSNGRTVTDEHVPWTYRLGNTHPLHFDSVYSHAQAAPMGGAPVVYGGLVFSWLAGLASRDTTENLVWDLGYTEGYHTQPTRTGDTLYALSRVISKEKGTIPGTGILNIQLIGVKNVSGTEALSKFGAQLFIKENDKKKLGLDKIPSKIFEIERRLLIRARS